MSFSNVYNDELRAEAYSTLDLPGTYYLAFRDLPSIIARHVNGRRALDFGCGAGRSTRFLKRLGFDAIGIDISSSMIEMASRLDPDGKYRLVDDGDYSALAPGEFDLILAAFPFDNIPDAVHRREILRRLRALLANEGRIIVVGSSSDIYLHEWVSFTTKDFPENVHAKSGETVRIVMKDVTDSRPVVDVLWFHEDYLSLFATSELGLIAQYAPLGHEDDPYEWSSETSISPWFIYVLRGISQG